MAENSGGTGSPAAATGSEEMVSPFVELTVEEKAGIRRLREPVLVGLPLPQGFAADPARIQLRGEGGLPVPLQAEIAAHWPDGSIQWLHCVFFASAEASQKTRYFFHRARNSAETDAGGPHDSPAITIGEDHDGFRVDTGVLSVYLPKSGGFHPWATVSSAPDRPLPIQTGAMLSGAGYQCRAEVVSARVENSGPLHCTVLSEGTFCTPLGDVPLRFRARHHLYAGLGFCRLDFLVHNPRAARHAQSLWDLGDERSVFVEDLSLVFKAGAKTPRLLFKTKPGEAFRDAEGEWELFQASSGGPNWQSVNHINREGKIPLPFRGCRIRGQGGLETLDRATPVCVLQTGDEFLGVTLRDFWQNFPKALQNHQGIFRVQLFPGEAGDPFEIQPGEQKAHTLFLQGGNLEGAGDGETPPGLDWAHAPLIPVLPAEWYVRAGIHPHLTSPGSGDDPAYFSILEKAVRGERSFFAKREIIDEYGWRNFGDVYADHESAFNEPGKPSVSHYNNQYDLVYGAILHYWRSGTEEWRRFADELARHVRDIDIYHTRKDRYEFNGGLFWHSNHYMAAETATHRCFSRKHWIPGYGGGPSPAHCYAAGLIHHYYLTGERESLEGARELADYALRLLLGAPSGGERLLTALRRAAKRVLAFARRQKLKDDLAAPTRAAANVLSVLLDSYQLLREEKYLEHGEDLIRRCVSVKDDPEAMDLLDAENNWSYMMFLQTVGRFLDVLAEKGETGSARHAYAVAVLLHYAKWMAVREKPFLSRPEKLKYPTETWAAIELRKTNVFLYAIQYGGGEDASLFRERAEFFYRQCFSDLARFPEQVFFARPLAILMANGLMYFSCRTQR